MVSKRISLSKFLGAVCVTSAMFIGSMAHAQEWLPTDNGLEDYHTQPRWRESEAHPLRLLAYVVHPIGWLAREAVFRPISYFASSSEVRRSVMGYREPSDYRGPECFSADESIPDCRSIKPFNYSGNTGATNGDSGSSVYFPNVNFDFNRKALTSKGQQQVKEIAQMLKESPVNVVLEGHTDAVGGESYNKKLGLDRAEAVKRALAKAGVKEDTMSTVSFGESRPKMEGDSEEARAANRRVEVQVERE